MPCFVRWPAGKLRGPGDVDELTTCQDLLPTLIDLCGLKDARRARFDGTSLAGLLRGSSTALRDRMIVVQYHIEIPKWNATVMWKKWRLVKGEELYDIATDPGQKTNIAEKHPDIVKAMRDHYERWWAEVEPMAKEPCCVHIGSERENPVRLTCADWYMVYADNFRHLQESINSYWNLLVERDGNYEFALTRWPPEAGAALDVALTHPIGQGKALPIAKARLKIGDFDQSKPVAPGDKSVVFTVPLKAGRTRLQTWFYDQSGNELCGAFYVMAYRR